MYKRKSSIILRKKGHPESGGLLINCLLLIGHTYMTYPDSVPNYQVILQYAAIGCILQSYQYGWLTRFLLTQYLKQLQDQQW
jgi:hypothetical protein